MSHSSLFRRRLQLTLVLSLACACGGLGSDSASADEPPAEGEASTAPAEKNLPAREPEDLRIAERLQTIFSLVEELKKANVSVRLGVVHLSGTVLSEADKKRAGELAGGLEGVVFVDNDLEVAADVGERVNPIVARLEKRFDSFVDLLPLFGVALVVFIPFVLLARVLASWKAPFKLVTRTPLVRGIVQRVVASLLLVVGVILALQILDATALVGAVLGTAGVLGVALGFAFRDIVENYLASILLGIRRPFEVQDLVLVNEHEGKVVRMTMRETILLTLDGNHLRMPNAMVFKAVIVNYTRNPLRRFDFLVGAGVEEDLGEAQRVAMKVFEGMPGVLEDPPPFSLVEELAAASVSIRIFGWIDQQSHDVFKVRSAAIRRVKVALDDAGIEMPEPIHRVRVERHHAPPARPAHLPEELTHEIEADETIDRQIQHDLAEGNENLLS